MTAVFKREFRSYFNTMTGYIFVVCVVFFTGIYFMALNLSYGLPYFSGVLTSMPLIYCIAAPILTMKSFAEERKSKTDQLLLTSPVSVGGVVMGKFLSMMAAVAIPILISCLCPLIIALNGNSHLGVDYASILAFFFMCGLFVSIGMFISSLTDNQVISAVVTFGILLILYLWDNLVDYIPSGAAANLAILLTVIALIALFLYSRSKNTALTLIVTVVLAALAVIPYLIESTLFNGLIQAALSSFSIMSVIQNFATYHVFDLGGLFFYISVTALFIFLTMQSIQKRRWS